MRSVAMWAKDTFTRDDLISGTPEQFARKIDERLAELSPKERAEKVEHLRQYTNHYWLTHHGKASVPGEDVQRYEAVKLKANNMDDADAAHAYLKTHGSPAKAFAKFEQQAQYRGIQQSRFEDESRQQIKQKGMEKAKGVAKELGQALAAD